MFSLEDIVKMAIQIEKNGEKAYRKALQAVSDLSLVSLLQHLADEEARHIQWFSELPKKAQTATDDPTLDKSAGAILQRIIGNQVFSLADVDFSTMEGLETLLIAAVDFEKDTVLFYEMIRPFVQDRFVLSQLDTIIEEERRHVRNLQKFLEASVIKHDETEPEGD